VRKARLAEGGRGRVPAGEGAKALTEYAALREGMLAAGIGRDGVVVALGVYPTPLIDLAGEIAQGLRVVP